MSNGLEERFSGLEADDSPFQTVSETEVSNAKRLWRAVDEFVVAPVKILWLDWRARIGGAIILLFVLMGTVGTLVVPEPDVNQAERMLGFFETMAHPLGSDAAGGLISAARGVSRLNQ